MKKRANEIDAVLSFLTVACLLVAADLTEYKYVSAVMVIAAFLLFVLKLSYTEYYGQRTTEEASKTRIASILANVSTASPEIADFAYKANTMPKHWFCFKTVKPKRSKR